MLEGHQRVYLRGLGHDLDPVVHIGRGGVGEAVVAQVSAALSAHELVKLRFVDPLVDRVARGEAAARLAAATASELVGQSGRTCLLYRQAEDPERRRIELPSRRRNA